METEVSIQELEFDSHGTTLRAGYIETRNSPFQSSRGTPCIVMAHGLGGTRAAGLTPFMQRFGAAGFRVLCFDYRYFGRSDGKPRQWISVARQLEDWAAAIKFARSLPGVDPTRIATWGSSFSGAHSVAAAVKDGSIAGVSAQGAMMDGFASLLNLIEQSGIAHVLKLSAYGIADAFSSLFGHGRVTMPVVGHPGETAALITPDSKPGYLRITPPDWINAISCSWALTIASYRPNTMTPLLPCPALFCIATEDKVVPPSAMEDGARRAPQKVTVKRYACGHFEVYVPPMFEQVVADQVEFFQRVLRPA